MRTHQYSYRDGPAPRLILFFESGPASETCHSRQRDLRRIDTQKYPPKEPDISLTEERSGIADRNHIENGLTPRANARALQGSRLIEVASWPGKVSNRPGRVVHQPLPRVVGFVLEPAARAAEAKAVTPGVHVGQHAVATEAG